MSNRSSISSCSGAVSTASSFEHPSIGSPASASVCFGNSLESVFATGGTWCPPTSAPSPMSKMASISEKPSVGNLPPASKRTSTSPETRLSASRSPEAALGVGASPGFVMQSPADFATSLSVVVFCSPPACPPSSSSSSSPSDPMEKTTSSSMVPPDLECFPRRFSPSAAASLAMPFDTFLPVPLRNSERPPPVAATTSVRRSAESSLRLVQDKTLLLISPTTSLFASRRSSKRSFDASAVAVKPWRTAAKAESILLSSPLGRDVSVTSVGSFRTRS
mmetsp:Transcript_53141/g.142089  ORF Transcript_53141/g.142089 Transcript_53141/m.142089 type:complete len:277 (-) Transcript_53141:702-1532(-)